jgi:hypothetical protein
VDVCTCVRSRHIPFMLSFLICHFVFYFNAHLRKPHELLDVPVASVVMCANEERELVEIYKLMRRKYTFRLHQRT